MGRPEDLTKFEDPTKIQTNELDDRDWRYLHAAELTPVASLT
jgi:hypothetical protein